MKEVVRFGKKEKLRPHYVGPCEILPNIGKAAYELRLPSEMAFVSQFSMFPCLESVSMIQSLFFLLRVLV